MKTNLLPSLVIAGLICAFHAHAAAKSDYIGQSYFPKGDSIEITSVKRTKDAITVTGRYNLISADSATLALYITDAKGAGQAATDSRQTTNITKGRWAFQLSHPHAHAGLPHVSMYDAEGKPFAELYFGTEEEAAVEAKMNLRHVAPPISIDSAPPVVVKTVPVAGATGIDPALTEIRVTFSKPMQDGSWSWSTWGEENFPEMVGNPHYLPDGRTCVLTVKLQPDKFYATWLNSEKFHNFKDASDRPAVPYLLTFTTGAAGSAVGRSAAHAAELAQVASKSWQEGKLEEGTAKFKAAVAAAPDNSDAWNSLGWANFNAGRNAEAEKAFKKAVELEPGHPAALNGLGQLYLAQNKLDEAEEYLIKAAPQAPAAWYGLARIYLLQAKFDQAETWARKIVDSGQADDFSRQMLQAAQAKQVGDTLHKQLLPPTPATAVSEEVSQAWKLMNSGRRVEARKLLEVELSRHPKDANAENALGWCLLNGGQASGAKSHFQKAIELDTNAAGAMNGLARVMKIEGNTDEAIKVWQQMIDRFPGPHAGTFGLADTYFERKEYVKAVPLLEQLAKANPSDDQIKTKLEQAREGAKP